MKYPKINTIFNRNNDGNIILSGFSEPEFEDLKDLLWECTEKIDGTNIRISYSVIFDKDQTPTTTLTIKGRTDAAITPKHLLQHLQEIFTIDSLAILFTPTYDASTEKFNDLSVVLFGEGYGVKIQNGSNYIPDGVEFILFDVFTNGI